MSLEGTQQQLSSLKIRIVNAFHITNGLFQEITSVNTQEHHLLYAKVFKRTN